MQNICLGVLAQNLYIIIFNISYFLSLGSLLHLAPRLQDNVKLMAINWRFHVRGYSCNN